MSSDEIESSNNVSDNDEENSEKYDSDNNDDSSSNDEVESESDNSEDNSILSKEDYNSSWSNNDSWDGFSSSSFDSSKQNGRNREITTILTRNTRNSFSSSDDNLYYDNTNRSRLRTRKRMNNDSKRYSPNRNERSYNYRNKKSKRITRKTVVNVILCISILLWIVVQIRYNLKFNSNTPKKFLFQKNNGKVPDYILKLRHERQIKSKLALGSGANPHSPPHYKKEGKGGNKEKPPPGCEFTKWQMASYPTCNDVHAIDLFDLNIQPPFSRKNKKYISKPVRLNTYIGSGLWRDVFKLQSGEVIKLMKMEHEMDERNIDRHRRDAIVMEKFSFHDNIITPYAYCGTSTITPFYDLRLDAYLHHKNYNDDDNTIHVNTTVLPHLNRNTHYGRVNLALQISKAIMALHTAHGPIVHADLQTKQFLIDKHTSTVILSDFNRCRFMALSNNTKCPFRIPSAPGKHRSPEEYLNKPTLDEKLDIFSLGHVFYAIITGKPAIPTFEQSLFTKNIVKRSIVNGLNPFTHTTTVKTDKVLWGVLERMYSMDVDQRISATEIVHILENHFSTLKYID